MFSDVRADKMLLFWKVLEHTPLTSIADYYGVIIKCCTLDKDTCHYFSNLNWNNICVRARHSQRKWVRYIDRRTRPGRCRGCLQVTFKQTLVIMQYCRVQVRGQAWSLALHSGRQRSGSIPRPGLSGILRRGNVNNDIIYHSCLMSHACYWHSEWGVLSVSFVEHWTPCYLII